MPDYRSAIEIEAENRKYPLRAAIQQVAEISWSENFSPPSFAFRPARPGQAPSDYRSQLPDKLRTEMAHCQLLSERLDRCLAMFREGDLDAARNQDPSKRWRAWADLTVGRLIAVSTRVREYVLTLESLAANDYAVLGAQTNSIYLTADSNLRGGQVSEAAVAEARRYLDRCVEENRGTPWQFLAERELLHPTGLSINQAYVPAPPPVVRPLTPRPPVPRIELPKL